MWNPGDQVALRGMYNGKPWYVQSVLVVKDSSDETALLLIPGAECVAPWGYIHQKHGNNGVWDRWRECQNQPWTLETYRWHTNRLLILLEPAKFYSTILMWNDASSQFLCYYVNFQLPFTRSRCGFDTFDLELDIVIEPTFAWKWKDVGEYQQGILKGVLRKEWVEAIENAKPEVLATIDRQGYPMNNSWLDWQPDPTWRAPNLPVGWDQSTNI
jgi:hypothetical protein